MKLKTKPEIGINILSVVLAFLVWFAVMSLGDPAVSKKIHGIKVTMINGNAIEDLDKIYAVKNDSDVISINVRDKRSIVDRLSAEDFVARADLSKWNELGNVPIVVTCKNTRLDSNSYVQSSYSLQLDVEDLKSQTFPIELSVEGEPAFGYVLENSYLNPETVIIEAGESVINNIAKVEAVVEARGLDRSQDVEVPLVVTDRRGNELPYDKMKFISLAKDTNSVSVNVNLLKTNKIPIEIETMGRLPEGYVLDSIECDPQQIEVKGDKDKISKIESIKVSDVAFTLTGVTESFTREVDIHKFLPVGVVFAGKKNQKFLVKIHIKQLSNVNLNVAFNDIKLKNVPEDLNFEIMGTGTAVTKVYGPSESLLKLDSVKIRPSLDLQNCNEEKTYQLVLDLKLPDDCYAASSNVVYVRFFRPENNTEDNGENENLTNPLPEEEDTVLPGGENEASGNTSEN